MKIITFLFAFIICATVTIQSAHAAGCKGGPMIVFHPGVQTEVTLFSAYGEITVASCTTGSAGKHICECITTPNDPECRYTVSVQGFFETDQSGGCKWRVIEGVCWCVNETCNTEEGAPHMVAPMQ